MGNASLEDSAEAADTRTGGLSPSRRAQLERDLELTPEERVRAGEETLQLDRLRRTNIQHRVIGFDRYEDYLDHKWKSSTGSA